MHLTAYLNSSGDVLATAAEIEGHITPDLAAAQAVDANIATRIEGAPDEIRYAAKAGLHGYYPPSYHRKASGDGTDIGDYVLVEDVTNYRADCVLKVDAETDRRAGIALRKDDDAIATVRADHAAGLVALDAASTEQGIIDAVTSYLDGGTP